MIKNIIYSAIMLTVATQVDAQNYDFPKNAETGKCYEKCFSYEEKFTWNEVDCKKFKTKPTKKDSIEIIRIRLKMKAYQDKLKDLGYDVVVSGCIDEKTIVAHHKYLRRKKKDAKRKLKAAKKAGKSD